MSLKINYTELKIQALEEAISYPPFKKEKDVPTLEIDEFNYNTIKEKLKDTNNSSTEGVHNDMILDMVQLLCEYKTKFQIESHSYIGFYWRGLPILILQVMNETAKNMSRMMYISVKVYKDELKVQVNDKKMQRGVIVGLGSLALFGGLFSIMSFFKSKE